MKSHRLLDGRLINLVECDARQKAFLTDLQKMARQGVSYFEVYRAAVGPGSPALHGRNRIDRRVVESPLYLVARDIATRAGIKQGLVLAPEHEHERPSAPRDVSMISVAQAADVVGITRAAIYKAIEKGTLQVIRIGNVTVVSRASAESYRDGRESLDKAQPRPRVRGRLRRAAKRPHADSAAARPAV